MTEMTTGSSYERNYGGAEDEDLVEMVEVGPHQVVRRDVDVVLQLRIVED